MRIEHLQEPELEFGLGQHVDIRFGIMDYGPLDVASDLAPKVIRAGLVGTPQTVEGLREWLEKCRNEIPAKQSRQPNLFPRFPGFRADTAFHASLVLERGLERTIPDSAFEELSKLGDANRFVAEAVTLFLKEFRYLVDNTAADVLLCAVPPKLADLLDPDLRPARAGQPGPPLDFHDILKAKAMVLDRPVQLVLPSTYDPQAVRRQKVRADRVRTLQDEATRAWNLHTALYYKARGLPWRVIRDPSQYTTCFVGVSFYRSLDRSALLTSMAQVFDERGDGMVIKGGPITLSKEDRTPHLDAQGSDTLLREALAAYRDVHDTMPARLVVHKTSSFSAPELDGFSSAASARQISRTDFVSVTRDVTLRLFRTAQYPPLRGTFLSAGDRLHFLYTRGSVEFYRTYPGLYVPRPLEFRCDKTGETPKHLAREMLALSKLNWNVSQFDQAYPITVEAARNVGKILKYTTEGDRIAPHYRNYM